MSNRSIQVKILRDFRKIHRYTGIALLLFFLLTALTGLLLGWKKNSNGYLLADTQKGTTSNLKAWLPIDSLYQRAIEVAKDSFPEEGLIEIERIDIRKEKGVVKFTFAEHFKGIQLDGATGKILSVETRRADFIEKIHDGSILDQIFGNSSGVFKLLYTSILGLALLTFVITGFWLWYGPKLLKRHGR